MAPRLLPIGIQDFEKVITNSHVYVDKTALVYRLTHTSGSAIFLSRPRRFGKSLLCSTLHYYFEGRKDLFKGLAIEKLETEWKQYPVLHFDVSRAKRETAEQVRDVLSGLLEDYETLYNIQQRKKTLGERLDTLIQAAHEKTGNQAVLIFDEYDSVMLSALDDAEKMKQVRSVFNEFYGPVKYMDEHLRFVFITGITKFSQMSIFSSINNLKNISMNEQWESICGITQDELEENFGDLIEAMGEKQGWSREQTLAKLRERYDGYHFGPKLVDIYNPFSILNALGDLTLDDYWFDSATPSALIKTLGHYDFDPKSLEGAVVRKMHFDQPFDNFNTAVPILYQSGYLTIKDYDRESERYTLGIPNVEVRRGLLYTLMQYCLKKDPLTTDMFVMGIKDAVTDDDINKALEELKKYLSAFPSDLSNKTHRDFQTIVRALFNGLGVEIDTEVKSALGRCDVVIKNDKSIYVLEFKTSAKGSASTDKALEQIDVKNYFAPYADDPRRKVKVAVTFDEATRSINDWKIDQTLP